MAYNHDRPFVPEAEPGESLFRVSRLCYRYGNGIKALNDIDLTIFKGDRIALVGQNGSGKTTLVKLLCGLLAPASGTVCYREEILIGDQADRCRLETGLLFQDPDDQLFGHTLLEDAAFGPRQQGLSVAAAETAAREALARVGLVETAYKAPHNLSFGQKKRAALAGLLAMKPEVLMLDEPTANLDPRQEEIFLTLLWDFPGSLICISHDLIFLYELCSRAVVLDQGRVHQDGSMRELVSDRQRLHHHGLDFSFRLAGISLSSFGTIPTPASPASIGCSPEASAPPNPPLVSLSDFEFRYPDGTRALRGINLDIRAGERLAIVGENGAGKTTLLSCLLGLQSGQGEFRFAGRPVTPRRRKSLWREVSMVFQDCADQLFCQSVAEELAFGLTRLGYSAQETESRMQLALARVGLSGFEDRVPLHLSGGERKRLALACALAMEPKLLILDEPTAGLDPCGERVLLEILRNLDATLLLVSHDMFFVEMLTRRTLVMDRGVITMDLPTHKFILDDAMGSLNGLAFCHRRDAGTAIQALQHQHEHAHSHQHLHIHEHAHGGERHTHPHEHTHEHPHRFLHRHNSGQAPHDHPPRRYHLHDHHGHERESHDHEHE